MHKLLRRQLARFLSEDGGPPTDWAGFSNAIDEAYRQSDHDRMLLERSLELTSQELLLRNEELRDELRRRERIAQHELERLAHALRSINESVSIIDLDGRLVFVNDAFSRTYGYEAAAVLGRTAAFLESSRNPPELASSIRSLALSGGFQGELWQRRSDGRDFQVSLSATALRDEDGQALAIVCVTSDVSQRRALEEQLRQSQKMEAVGLLAGGVAHDFNNLLTVVLAHCDGILDDTAHGDPRRESLEEIRRAGERAADLTRQLLAFSRRQVLRPRVLSLNAVVEQLQAMLRRLLGEDVELETALAAELLPVRADAGQLEQVLMNLSVNARDAMPRGGRLRIETRNATLDTEHEPVHPTGASGPHVVLAVRDTGCGMDEETLQRAFEPFFTTKGPGKGTGLGLSTVYGIVQQSGGFVQVHSALDEGTTFEVYLPALEVAVLHPEPVLTARRALSGTESVLLVEDELALRAVVRDVLRAEGYRVHEAAHGKAALAILEDPAVSIDLLLTDIVLPGLSGTAVAQAGSKLRPQLRVLYMSGYTEDAILRHGELPAGLLFLEKPFSSRTMLMRVRDALERAPGAVGVAVAHE
ncbi:MAG: ATP-binding protein [Polyangiales bacterium]